MNRRQFFKLLPGAAGAAAILISFKPRAAPAPLENPAARQLVGAWIVTAVDIRSYPHSSGLEVLAQLEHYWGGRDAAETQFGRFEPSSPFAPVVEWLRIDLEYARLTACVRFPCCARELVVGEIVVFGER